MNVHHLIPTVRKAVSSDKHQSSYHPLRNLQQEIDLMFDSFFDGAGFSNESTRSGILSPQMDISENDAAYALTLEIPGVEEKDLDISITGDTLSIRAEKLEEQKEEGKRFHRIERSYGAYVKQLTLPPEVDQNKIEADYKNGVLTLTLPKKPEERPESRKITLKGGKK